MTEYGHKLFKEFEKPVWTCSVALQPGSPGLLGQSWLPGHQLQTAPQFRCVQRHRLTHRPLQHPGTIWGTILGPSLRENIQTGRSSCWRCWWIDWMEHGGFLIVSQELVSWAPAKCGVQKKEASPDLTSFLMLGRWGLCHNFKLLLH